MAKILLERTGALGDVLELTAIARRLTAQGDRVFVKTNYPAVFLDSSDVTLASNAWGVADQYYDLNMSFENDLRQHHPIDSYSARVFGDTNTAKKIYFKFPNIQNLVVNNEKMDRPLAVVHPARSWPIRTLSHAFWQQLIDSLRALDFNVVITGTNQDWGGLKNCSDVRSMLDLAHQASLISYADVFICSESGPMILAQATKTPIIALLTMVPPHRVIHEDANITCLRAHVSCVGCEAHHPQPVKYIDCLHNEYAFDYRACVRDGMFDIDLITSIALNQTTQGTQSHV